MVVESYVADHHRPSPNPSLLGARGDRPLPENDAKFAGGDRQ